MNGPFFMIFFIVTVGLGIALHAGMMGLLMLNKPRAASVDSATPSSFAWYYIVAAALTHPMP